MSNFLPTRRDFFRRVFLLVGAGVLLDTVFRRGAWAQDNKLDYIDLTEKKRTDAANKACVQQAKNLNYRDKAADLAKDIKAKKVKSSVPEFKDKAGKVIALEERTCAKCLFFARTNPNVHTCDVIPGCLVRPEGSCTSFTPKP